MRSKYTRQEKYDMVIECRNSGLSDYQWCQRNGISHSTFYNWTLQLRNSGAELPSPSNLNAFVPASKPDIVKLNVIDDISLPSEMDNSSNTSTSVEIIIGKASIRISNNISQSLLTVLMSSIGGCL